MHSTIPYKISRADSNSDYTSNIGSRVNASIPGMNGLSDNLGLIPLGENTEGYMTAKRFREVFTSQYGKAVMDLASLSNYQSEIASIDNKLPDVAPDAHVNVTSWMRTVGLDQDRKGAYSRLHANDDYLLRQFKENQQNPEQNQVRSLEEVYKNIGSKIVQRVFNDSLDNKYINIPKATEIGVAAYAMSTYASLGEDKELTAIALGFKSTKSIDALIIKYDQFVESGELTTFNEWVKKVRKDKEMVDYYEERKQMLEPKVRKENQRTQRPVSDEKLVEKIPPNKDGKLWKEVESKAEISARKQRTLLDRLAENALNN